MYEIEKLRNLLSTEEYKVIDDNGRVLPPSNQIYKNISEAMDGNPSAKHVYVIVKNNRNGIYDFVLTSFGLLDSINQRSQDHSFDPDISTSKNMDKFNLKLTKEDWSMIMPEDKVYEDGRLYTTLQSGWSDIFARNIWMQFRVPCPWKFINSKISRKKNKTYCRLKANCNECSAKLICTLAEEPAENNVIFNCVIKNALPDYIHSKRRQLRGRRRALLANTLIDTKTDAISYVRTEAKTLIDFDGPYPPILPKTTVLRKAISETKNKRLGLTGSKPINNLINVKDTTHIGSVHNIGGSPFFCYYWTKEQKLLYKLHHKNDTQSFMTIDATGSIVKKIKYQHSKSSHIFLYQCMSVSYTGGVPVFQMLSAAQDTVTITSWLLKITSSGIPVPRMVVCDFSQALLISISIAFARKRDLREYMQACYDLITHKSQIVPTTFIRLDISHLVSIICRWDCLKRHPLPKVRQFFIRAICQAYKMEILQNLEYFLETILVVAMSPNIGRSCEQNLESQTRYDYISNIIKGTFSEMNEEVHTSTDEIDLEKDCHTGWLKWSKTIYERAFAIATKCENGDIINAFYNIEIAKKIMRLMHYLPIWTGVMIPFFNVGSTIATSSSVESEFANIKGRVFKNELPLRVDKFIIRHLDYIDGRVKEASANYHNTRKEVLKIKENDNINLTCPNKNIDTTQTNVLNTSTDVTSLNEYENWGGLGNVKSKKRKRPNYLDACPDWDYVQSHKTIEIPIFKNGNLYENNLRINEVLVIIKETCAFDSLIQLVMHAIGKEYRFKEHIQYLDYPLIKLAVNIINRGKLIQSDYVARAKILLDTNICKKTSTRHIQFANANCNVAHLIDILFIELPSVTRIKTCNNCHFIQSRPFPTLHINVGMLIKKGLGTVQEAIDDTKLNKCVIKCNQCNSNINSTNEYSSHVFLDTSLITDPNYEHETHFQSTLDSITKSIDLDGQHYKLCGIINYISYGKINSNINLRNGHYVAIAFTGMHWYEYDDLKKKRSYVSSQTLITPHVIMYTQ